mgnify:CR=1 FL=1
MHIVEQVLKNQGLGYVAEKGKVSSDSETNLLSQNMLPSLYGKIIISKDLNKELTNIINTLSENSERNSVNELGFFMFGYELENGDVMITKILSYFEEYNTAVRHGINNNAFEDQNSDQFKAISKEVNDFIKYSNYEKPVLFQGHTHPHLGSIFGYNSPFASGVNASWCDIRGLIETTEHVSEISNNLGKHVQFGNILINSILDFDVISYQNFGNGYKLYKHPNIYWGDERLPSYTPNKYLINDEYEQHI